jgi:hypothetical protein
MPESDGLVADVVATRHEQPSKPRHSDEGLDRDFHGDQESFPWGTGRQLAQGDSGQCNGLDHKIELAPGLRDAGKTDSRHAATPIISVFGPRPASLALAPA